MKLSIIVPVYGTEQYIVRCVNSLLKQDYNDYEIIVVDDGSPDRAIEILCDAVHNERVQIIRQKNAGLSAARNAGLAQAQGEYVWFFDSDDWASENCLGDIVMSLEGIDVLYFNSYYKEKDKQIIVISKNNDATDGCALSLCDIFYQVPFYIYRRSWLIENNLSFEPNLLHEDSMFTPMALYQAGKAKPYKSPVYHQYEHSASITHAINPKRCYDMMKIVLKHNEFAQTHVHPKDRRAWGNCIANTLNGLLAMSMLCDTTVQNDVNVFFANHNELISYMIHAKKFPTRIMGYLAKWLGIPIPHLYGVLARLRY